MAYSSARAAPFALALALALVACSRSSPTKGAATSATTDPLPSASAGAVGDAGAVEATADAPLVVVGDHDPKLQFSADGRLLRVATATKLAIYDASTRRLVGSADYPPDLGDPDAIFASGDDKQVRVVFAHAVFVHDGATASVVDSRKYKDDRSIVAQSRDLLVVVDGIDLEQGGAPSGEMSTIDLATLSEARLPKGWWRGDSASLTAKGDRLAITSSAVSSADAVIFDVAARRRVASVHNSEGGAGAGGIFSGQISADGTKIVWCHTRSGCTEQAISGGKPKPFKRIRVESEKWTIELPFEMDFLEEAGDSLSAEELARKSPLMVRDAKGAAVGALAMSRPTIGFAVQPVALCSGVDRAVGFAEGQLFVMSLPSGAVERSFALTAADQADVLCATGGRVAAAHLGDAVYLVPIATGGRLPVVTPPSPSPSPSPSSSANDGTDARKPILAPADEGFVDPKCASDKPRCGWGWASRCYDHFVKGRWGYAKAACDKGLAAAPTDPETRRMLSYNAGRVAEHAGDFAKARALYKQSLEIRDVAEVRSHLRAVEKR